MNTLSKEKIIELMRAWINQRPGLDFADYGDRSSYMSESRRITLQKNDAVALLRHVETSQITAEQIMDGFKSAYSGRLTLEEKDGEYRLSYCTGQYWPTEYRAAACAVLASALWYYHREDIPAEVENKGEAIRAKFVRMYGKPLASRWFS